MRLGSRVAFGHAMAAMGRKEVLFLTLLWLSLSAFAIVESSNPGDNQSTELELPFVGPSCDSSTPVCGEGSVDFDSACDAKAAGVRILHTGSCTKESKRENVCNIRCFRADPVCGTNGVTYWCGAPEAKCNGVDVAYNSYCEPGSGGAGKTAIRALQSLFLVHFIWLILAGFLVTADLL